MANQTAETTAFQKGAFVLFNNFQNNWPKDKDSKANIWGDIGGESGKLIGLLSTRAVRNLSVCMIINSFFILRFSRKTRFTIA